MKNLLCIILLLPACVYGQSSHDFRRIDDAAMSISSQKADTLAKQLAALGNTDREKVRAIFRWITEHIDYNMIFFDRRIKPVIYKEEDDSNAALPPLNERVAAKVLKRKVAFCDGYARLFKTLCDHVGIPCEIILGYARNNITKKFAVNHTWNAVHVDGAWQLVDVTWGSGFVTYSNEYIKRFNDFYFLTPPDQFIQDHYPEDLRWTLLNDPPIYREFNQSPFRYPGFLKFGVTNNFPAKGVIEAEVGDTIQFHLGARREITNFYVSTSPVFDTTQMINKPTYNGENVSFKCTITPGAGEWLYVFCNEELTLRYKLNIKKDIGLNKQ